MLGRFAGQVGQMIVQHLAGGSAGPEGFFSLGSQPGVSQIQRDVGHVLAAAQRVGAQQGFAGEPAQQEAGQAVLRRNVQNGLQVVLIAAQVGQNGTGGKVTGVGFQRQLQMLDGLRLNAPAQVDAGDFIIAGAAPAVLPRRGPEQIVSLVQMAFQPFQTGHVVNGLGVGGVVIAHFQLGDGSGQIAAGADVIALFEHGAAHGQIAAQVGGVPAQALKVVILGHIGVMLVLLQMGAVEIKLLDGGHVLRIRRDGPGLGGLLLGNVDGLIAYQHLAGSVAQGQAQVGLLRTLGQGAGVGQRVFGGQIGGLFVKHLAVQGQADDGTLALAGGQRAEMNLAVLHAQGQRAFQRGVLGFADGVDGIPHLREHLGLAGHDIGEVRLVVGVNAGHQLDIAVAVVGQVGAPGTAEGAVAPSPHFLAHAGVVAGNSHGARVCGKIVAAEEVHLALTPHHHDGGGQLDVGEPGGVRALAVVEGTGGLVHALHHREGNDGPAVMVVAVGHIRREGGLVLGVYPHGQIVPPHKGQGRVGAVVDHSLGFHIGAAGVHGDTNHAAHPVERLGFAHPDGDGAVCILFGGRFQRHEGGGTVVLGPVELHTAGHPRAGNAHHGGLDDGVLVDKLVAVVLIHRAVDLAAQLRQQHDLYVLVFQRVGIVLLIYRLVGQTVGVGHGINTARRSLIGFLFQKEGQGIGGVRLIGRDGHRFMFENNVHRQTFLSFLGEIPLDRLIVPVCGAGFNTRCAALSAAFLA